MSRFNQIRNIITLTSIWLWMNRPSHSDFICRFRPPVRPCGDPWLQRGHPHTRPGPAPPLPVAARGKGEVWSVFSEHCHVLQMARPDSAQPQLPGPGQDFTDQWVSQVTDTMSSGSSMIIFCKSLFQAANATASGAAPLPHPGEDLHDDWDDGPRPDSGMSGETSESFVTCQNIIINSNPRRRHPGLQWWRGGGGGRGVHGPGDRGAVRGQGPQQESSQGMY